MRDQRESPLVALWLERLERTADNVELETEKQSIAYGHWLTVAGERRDGMRGRLAEAAPFVPSMVWLALLHGGSLLVAYMCFYADPREPWLVQATMMGTVTAMVVTGLLVVRFLDKPYENASGCIKPTVMTQTLAGIAGERCERRHRVSVRRRRSPAADVSYARPASASGRRPQAKRVSYQPVIGASVVPRSDECAIQPDPR